MRGRRAFSAVIGVTLSASLTLSALATPSVAHAADDDVNVKVTGDTQQVVLERAIVGTDLWESVCTGACDTNVPRDGKYRVSGHGVRESLPIALLPAVDNSVHLEVRSAYTTGWIGGLMLTIIGPIMTLSGIVAIATFTPPGNFSCPPNACNSTDLPIQSNAPNIGGALLIGVGLVLTGMGIGALVLSEHTNVRQVGPFAFSASGRGVRVTF